MSKSDTKPASERVSRRDPTGRLLVRGSIAYSVLDRAVERVLRVPRYLLRGLLRCALSAAERTELTIGLYSRNYLRDFQETETYEWEKDWFEEALPAPPARLFLGGAGTGRELRHLLSRGYRLDVLEPAPTGARICAKLLGDRGRVYRGSYEDLSRTILDRVPIDDMSELSDQRYDSLILGWGSLTHVFDPIDRERLMRACVSLCPTGPILASFWLNVQHPKPGRSELLGRKLGEWVRRHRGLPQDGNELIFSVDAGFAHSFTTEEIRGLAAAVDRTLRLFPIQGYPHATFLQREA
jgi:hypothetical protein